MSEDIYAKPDLTKKVRFQTGEKEDRNTDIYDDIRIYDNNCPDGSVLPKSQDNTSDDQQQSIQLSVPNSGSTLFKPAAVFVGLLCLVLLAAVIVLVILLVQDKTDWKMERNKLNVLNSKLVSERDELQISFNEMKSAFENKTNQCENERNLAKLNQDKHNQTIHALLKQIEGTRCPAEWIKFDNSCYLISTSKKNWYDSRKACENNGAQLVIISTVMEQAFIYSRNLQTWIGLSDEKTENRWIWANGMAADTMYWATEQPDNFGHNENCVEMNYRKNILKNWNDRNCDSLLNFICERTLQ